MPRHLIALFSVLILATDTALATRPLTIDDADPTPEGQCQLSAGISLEHSGTCQDWDYPFGAAYGIATNLELNANCGAGRSEIDDGAGHYGHASGMNDLLLGLKWQFLGESEMLPRQTLEPAIKIPTASHSREMGSGRPDYDLTWVASRKLGEKFQLDVNLGYTLVGHPNAAPECDVLHGGVALEYQLCETWQWVGEVFGDRALRGDEQVSVLGSTGLRWLMMDGLTADAAMGTGLSGKDTPRFTATLGLSWLFNMGSTK